MATYNDLSPEHYYLVQENENSNIELVYVMMATSKCILVEYQDEEQTMSWYKKTEPLFEMVEKLTEEQAVIYESLLNEDDEDEVEEWDEESDDPWFNEDDEEEPLARKN